MWGHGEGIQSGGNLMTIQRALLLLLCVAALAGCNVPVKTQMTDTATLSPGKGVMVAHLWMPYLGRADHIRTFITLASDGALTPNRTFELESPETTLVLPLSAGSYRWKYVSMGNYITAMDVKFDIEAGKINYIGAISMIMTQTGQYRSGYPVYNLNFRTRDNRGIYLDYIATAYPQLSANYPVVVNLTHR